jgi:hypothetical protein
MKENDFGFSIVSEEELKAHEEVLKQQYVSENSKLKKMRNMIMPLLHNLCENEEKEYIYWPNRKQKLQEFMKKIDSLVEND